MPLYQITVTEAPRTGQRRPRVHNYGVVADSPEAALAAWKADHLSELYGNQPQLGDTVAVHPEPITRPVRLPW